MKTKQCLYLFVIIAFFLSSCDKDKGLENKFEPKTYTVSGKVEKGPFVIGSTVTIQPMDGNLQALGSPDSTTIQDNFGSFSFEPRLFQTPYAEVTANGYFFNEIKGEFSTSKLRLRALVDLSDGPTANVNFFTHLKYQRIQKLITDNIKFGEADKQAQEELFSAFGLQKHAEKDASTFSITEGTDEATALIAISSLLLVDKSGTTLGKYLAKLCKEFGEKGTFEESTIQQIRGDKEALWSKLSSVRSNIIEYYETFGLEVEVKELERFIDWDNDGIAGNEVLLDGQEVILERTELNVPKEGGIYTIGISSPIPVYLEPRLEPVDPDEPPIVIPNDVFSEIYENVDNTDISIEKSINANELIIKVSPSIFKIAKSTSVQLYDCLGNILGEVKILQEGNKNAPTPKLRDTMKQIVNSFASEIAQGFSKLNLIEQYYYYNKESDWVNQHIHPSSNVVYDIWGAFYRANRVIMTFKDAEAKKLGVYQDYLNVFSAMYYYYMVVLWGDVPYINFVPNMDNTRDIRRTPQNEIFTDLQKNLEEAINYFKEKRNESLNGDANDFFFLSKDVARILLANIYMYQGEYIQAEKLLEEVINNGFYELDTSNYNKQETITNLFNSGSGKETIFATKHNMGGPKNSGNIFNVNPLPIMTYTDVILSHAECLYKNGKSPEAESLLTEIATAKSINLSGSNVLEKIKDARLQLMLYSNTNFAFMKRNDFAKDVYGIEEYRLLLPIPMSELTIHSQLTQNPGY